MRLGLKSKQEHAGWKGREAQERPDGRSKATEERADIRSSAQAHNLKPGPPMGPLTTLSSGTERLRVHSWLFTNESAKTEPSHQATVVYTHTCPNPYNCHLKLPREQSKGSLQGRAAGCSSSCLYWVCCPCLFSSYGP